MILVNDKLTETEVSFKHAIDIHKPYGVLDSIIDWVKVNTQGRWGWQLVRSSSSRQDGRYIFFFDDERDLLTFTLRWQDGD